MKTTDGEKILRLEGKTLTKKVFVSNPEMAPVDVRTVRAEKPERGREVQAAKALGLELDGVSRERPLSRTFRARRAKKEGADAPLVALVVVSDAATDAERELFARMADDLRAAGDAAPGVLRVYDVAPTRDAFVSDLWTAGSARDLSALKWTPRQRGEFVQRIVTELEGLHAIGLVHGCLCPANVLLDDDLRPVLAEAGTVPVHALAARGGDAELYAAYAAPEVTEGQPPDARSDVYSVGRILEAALKGDETAAVTAVVQRCVSADPAQRYGTAAELRTALEGVVGLLRATDVVAPPPEVPPAPRPVRHTARPTPAEAALAIPGHEAPSEPWIPPRWLSPVGAMMIVGAIVLALLVGGTNEAMRPLLVVLLAVGAALATTIVPPMPKARVATQLALAAAAVALALVVNPLAIAFRLAAQRHLHGDDAARRSAIAEVVRLGRDFRGMSLAHLDLSGLDLAGADLRNVDLSGANLSRTRLFGAEVQGASFEGTNLAGADLDQVELTLANVEAASCDAATQLPRAWRCSDGHLTRGAH